jgi:hypothetical protein
MLLALLHACRDPDPGFGHGGTRDTASEYLPPRDGGGDLRVEQVEDPGATWACADEPAACTADYLAFPAMFPEEARPVSAAAIEAAVAAIEDGEVAILDEVGAGDLAATLGAALNMDFLIEGLDERLLAVTLVEGTGTERRLLFADPFVGTFQVRLLLPGSEPPWAGVLALHGHGQESADVLDDLFGRDYAADGLALATLDFRAMGADASEDEAVRALLEQGFTLEALRIYESLLVLKYLRWLPEVDGARLAVVGHSGGSVAWNLAIRRDPPIAAYVSDLTSDYCDVWKGWLLDDTVPDLYPVHVALNELETAGLPVLRVPYGYPDGIGEILGFLEEHLAE